MKRLSLIALIVSFAILIAAAILDKGPGFLSDVRQQDSLEEDMSAKEATSEEPDLKDDKLLPEEVMEDKVCKETEENVMENSKEQFYATGITDEIFSRMQGKSYKADAQISTDELSYLHVLHVGFDGEVHEGEIVCNKAIADDLLEVFKELFDGGYQIEKIRLIDEYDADDEASMQDNNTSCFNYRLISHTNRLSNHAMGCAVDINPLYNPYIRTVNGMELVSPDNATDYADRSRDFPHKITTDDLCYRIFTEHGFSWGGNWNNSKDYQHFEKQI